MPHLELRTEVKALGYSKTLKIQEQASYIGNLQSRQWQKWFIKILERTMPQPRPIDAATWAENKLDLRWC